MSKFTPGPWRIGHPPPNGQQTIGTKSGMMVAVATVGENCPTTANAKLIAAAPELYETLKLLVNHCEYINLNAREDEEILDEARSILDKVTK